MITQQRKLQVLFMCLDNKRISIELASSDIKDESRLALTFDKSPMQLRSIVVTDPNGSVMNLFLLNPKFGAKIDSEVFVFQDPNRRRKQR